MESISIFDYLDSNKSNYLSENKDRKKDAKKDVAQLAALVRGNKLRWKPPLSNTDTILDDELVKVKVLKMLEGYFDIITGNCQPYEVEEYWQIHWDDPDQFELFHRVLMPKEVKPLERKTAFNVCCNAAIDDFFNVNGYLPTSECVIERLRQKAPHGYIIEFHDKEITIDGSTPKAISNVKKIIRTLLSKR